MTQVPRFLDTCVGQPRKVVINHGVEIVNDEAQLVGRVVRLCRQWVQKVPVLVITSGPEELAKVRARHGQKEVWLSGRLAGGVAGHRRKR